MVKGKAIPLQVWTCPEGSRSLRLPDFKTIDTWMWYDCQPYTLAAFTTQEIVRVLIYVRSWVKPWGHLAAGRIMSMKNSSETIGNRTRDLVVCSAVPWTKHYTFVLNKASKLGNQLSIITSTINQQTHLYNFHLKPLRNISNFSDHHRGVSSFLAKVITYSRFSSFL